MNALTNSTNAFVDYYLGSSAKTVVGYFFTPVRFIDSLSTLPKVCVIATVAAVIFSNKILEYRREREHQNLDVPPPPVPSPGFWARTMGGTPYPHQDAWNGWLNENPGVDY